MEIKNCPFCGGESFLEENEEPSRTDGEFFVTYTPSCEDRICIGSSIDVSFATEECAIQAWNKRKGE